MKTALAHTCIETENLEATEAFYGLLGLRRQFEFRNLENELVGVYLAFDNQTYLEVIVVGEARSTGCIRHFAIEVDSVAQAHDTLQQAGVDVSAKKLGGDQTWMVTCTDPNGVFIELHEYTAQSMQLKGGVCEVDYTVTKGK